MWLKHVVASLSSQPVANLKVCCFQIHKSVIVFGVRQLFDSFWQRTDRHVHRSACCLKVFMTEMEGDEIVISGRPPHDDIKMMVPSTMWDEHHPQIEILDWDHDTFQSVQRLLSEDEIILSPLIKLTPHNVDFQLPIRSLTIHSCHFLLGLQIKS